MQEVSNQKAENNLVYDMLHKNEEKSDDATCAIHFAVATLDKMAPTTEIPLPQKNSTRIAIEAEPVYKIISTKNDESEILQIKEDNEFIDLSIRKEFDTFMLYQKTKQKNLPSKQKSERENLTNENKMKLMTQSNDTLFNLVFQLQNIKIQEILDYKNIAETMKHYGYKLISIKGLSADLYGKEICSVSKNNKSTNVKILKEVEEKVNILQSTEMKLDSVKKYVEEQVFFSIKKKDIKNAVSKILSNKLLNLAKFSILITITGNKVINFKIIENLIGIKKLKEKGNNCDANENTKEFKETAQIIVVEYLKTINYKKNNEPKLKEAEGSKKTDIKKVKMSATGITNSENIEKRAIVEIEAILKVSEKHRAENLAAHYKRRKVSFLMNGNFIESLHFKSFFWDLYLTSRRLENLDRLLKKISHMFSVFSLLEQPANKCENLMYVTSQKLDDTVVSNRKELAEEVNKKENIEELKEHMEEVEIKKDTVFFSSECGICHRRLSLAYEELQSFLENLEVLQLKSEPNVKTLFYEGYLKKKNSITGQWKTRWFVLKNNKLYYYKNHFKKRLSGILDFELININLECLWNSSDYQNDFDIFIEKPDGKLSAWRSIACCCCARGKNVLKTKNLFFNNVVRFSLKPIGSRKIFELQGPYIEVMKWLDLIKITIELSKNLNDYRFLRIVKEPNFWAVDRICPTKFYEIANTGDILLFKSKQILCKIQRAITMNEYDHIAMIIRNQQKTLFILEAIGNEGVIMTKWETFIENKWHKDYLKIVLRRLHWRRSNEQLKQLLEFLKISIGRPYKLSFRKLLGSSTNESSVKDFFCSQLVASAWKSMGVLSNSSVATKLWPSAFSDKAKTPLKLNSGNEIDNELLIDFKLEPNYDCKIRE